MTARIKVAVRVRPFLESERRTGYQNSLLQTDKERKQVTVRMDGGNKSFKFDHVFSQEDQQQDVFDGCEIGRMVERAIEGYHSTILTYGQTGSGKTYTMQGTSEENSQLSGIIPQTVQMLFQKTQQQNNRLFTLSVSFLQIYNEKIYDLLNPSSLNPKNLEMGQVGAGLRMRWNKDDQFSVQNLFICQCKSYQQFLEYFTYGLSNRINSCHRLNMSSSRSHSILSVRIESIERGNPRNILSSRIELVDLAGSQRIGLTGSQGKLAKQSIDINKSLFTLRQVISILSENRRSSKDIPHIPYRDSKLTSILKQSIGGNSYSLMVACISPNDIFLDQNLSTLSYATKASYIHNKPTINDDPRNKIIGQLKHQIQSLRNELNQANRHIQIMGGMQQIEHDRPHTDRSQRLPIDDERSPLPIFKKKSVLERSNSNQNFSQRLIESINMVRELLQSNKELREQMEVVQKQNDERSVSMVQLQRQNEQLREKINELMAGNHIADEDLIKQYVKQPVRPVSQSHTCRSGRGFSRQRQRPPSTTYMQRPPSSSFIQHSNPIVYGNNVGSMAGKYVDNTFNSFNSFQINQFIIGQKAPDCIPTNFNRRHIFSSQQERRKRNSSDQPLQQQKKPMTANTTTRKKTRNVTRGFSAVYTNFKESALF